MSEPDPTWRQGFDGAERAMSPRLETLLRSGGFVTGVRLVMQLNKEIRRRVGQLSQQAFHAVNQPTARDVSRILAEVRRLQGDVRRVSEQLEQAERGKTCPPTTQPAN
jgi:hypothetical protein